MSDDFSKPIYDQAPSAPTGVTAGQSAPAATHAAATDLNDLSLLSESLDTNEHLDAYAAPPPIPDGTYTVKLKRIDTKDGKPWTIKEARDGTKFLYTQHELTIIDPSGQHDGKKLYDRYVSTLPDRNKAVPMVAVLKAMGVAIPARATAGDLWNLYDKASKSEPTIRVTTAWEANLPQEISEEYKSEANRAAKRYAPRLLGQSKFPKDAKGNPMTEALLDVSNIKGNDAQGKPVMAVATAQARVSQYLALK